jgi:predicted transcriptional regulator
MRSKKSEFMQMVDSKLAGNADLARRVEAALTEMRVEQDLAAEREKLGITQTELAHRMGVTQSRVAGLESGRGKNLELRTYVRWVTALGGQPILGYTVNGHRRLATAKH